MYEDYFGLERPPFKITPDTSLFFEGGKRGDILAALVYAIHRGEGIIKVVGEVGSGKTMLCRMLQLKLPDSVEIVYIANPSVSPEDILFVIALELSLPVSKRATKHEVMHQLQDYLLNRHMENKQVVLFIEEAQGMPLETLEEIRLLSNLETDQNKLLQIILFGQPELDQNLSQRSIRQLRERITHNFHLDPLTADEIHSYLNFRMREVGYTGPELIDKAIARKVEQHSGGLLRRINILADKVLLSAFSEGTHNLKPKHVSAAVTDSAFDGEIDRKSHLHWWLGLLIAAALAFGIFHTRIYWMPPVIALWHIVAAETALLGPKARPASPVPAEAAREELAALETVAPILADETARSEIGGVDKVAPVEAAEVVTPEIDSAEIAEIAEPAALNAQPALQPESTEVEAATESLVAGATAVEVETAPAKAETEELIAAEAGAKSEDLVETVAAIEQQIKAIEQQAEIRRANAPEPARAAEDKDSKKALDQAASSEVLATTTNSGLTPNEDYNQWLEQKLRESREWLSQADRDKVSIQVLMRSKSAARELVHYLRNEWPLDLSETYLYEIEIDNRRVYRVFYSEFDTLTSGRNQLDKLPESVKVNSPYLHSVHRMQKALL